MSGGVKDNTPSPGPISAPLQQADYHFILVPRKLLQLTENTD